MNKLNQSGGLDVWIVISVVFILLFLGGAGFGVWAFTSRQDYKTNVDKKIAKAVVIAKQEESTAKDKEFVEKEKLPLKDYKGPATYGSISISYPKTWSAFVTEGDSSNPINGYFHPNFVPGVQSGTAFALHVMVVNQPYDTIMKTYSNLATQKKVTISAYRAPKVSSVLGSRVEGEINNGQKGVMIAFPLRDKTLEISTQSTQFLNDLNTIILENLTFSP